MERRNSYHLVPFSLHFPCALSASLRASSTLETVLMLALFPITPILHTLPAVGPKPPEISTRWLKTNFDELNISRLMIQNNIVEKSLEAIILEAKQELFKEESCTNEYVKMTVNLRMPEHQNCCKVFSSISNNSMSDHYEPMFARSLLV